MSNENKEQFQKAITPQNSIAESEKLEKSFITEATKSISTDTTTKADANNDSTK